MRLFARRHGERRNVKENIIAETVKKDTKKKDTNGGNGICELVFILDRSGSMSGLENDTIGGFNSLIEKQKKEDGKCYVTTVLFDHMAEKVHDRVELSEIAPMTRAQYYVRGNTALLDAVGDTIEHISDIHKYIRKEDIPQRTMFVITTDGMENASRRYTAEKVKSMIKAKKKECEWEFLFLGANIDAVSAAGNIGIAPDRAVRFHNDARGTAVNYSAVSDAIGDFRACAPMAADWKKNIEEDYKSRSK